MPKEDTQFKKGQSGNPAGKPPGTKNFSTDFDEAVADIAKLNNITVSEARKILLKRAYSEAKDGNFNFYKDIVDRYYGKPLQSLDLTSGGKPIPLLKGIADDTDNSPKEAIKTEEKN